MKNQLSDLNLNIIVSAFQSQISALKSLLTKEQLDTYSKIVEIKKQQFIALNPQLSASQREWIDRLFQ